MKKILIALVSGLLIGAVAMTVLPANANTAGQIRKLKRRVAGLEDAVFVCIGPVPVNQYGVPPEEGYVYDLGDTDINVTALDITADEDEVQGFFATISSDCVGSSRQGSAQGVFTPLSPAQSGYGSPIRR